MILRLVDPAVPCISHHLIPARRRVRALTALANLLPRCYWCSAKWAAKNSYSGVPMTRKALYLVFCVLGFALPYSQFLPWVVAHHGVPLGLFLRELFANRIGAFFGMDVLVSAVVLIFFVRREAQRLGVRHLWLPIVGTLTVGVSLGFPLFLYLREDAMERAVGTAGASAGLTAA